jgi:hypothetical protein
MNDKDLAVLLLLGVVGYIVWQQSSSAGLVNNSAGAGPNTNTNPFSTVGGKQTSGSGGTASGDDGDDGGDGDDGDDGGDGSGDVSDNGDDGGDDEGDN